MNSTLLSGTYSITVYLHKREICGNLEIIRTDKQRTVAHELDYKTGVID